MAEPSQLQIETVINVLRLSIESLIANDVDIFDIDLIDPPRISMGARILNRELHETSINHRLAYYLEQNIRNTELPEYSVDIEYNRFYGNPKVVRTVDGLLQIRPDIIIHSRVNDRIDPQHFLVIEAKKGEITSHDVNKILGLMTDPHYFYLFGFTISYCSNRKFIIGNLYYFDGQVIISRSIDVKR
ncbi:hypothetical protein [Dinghuibacter silviterrae]|uniref:Type I restriction and modification enzyme subunit R-like protein n=1 Tax=Dinghuibacter silviterrae TaxID=1539049 RepID=A0A4R8DRQ7_9BACT|nr:hypothetical protein [Dinghuibacter silviterrae]TDX00526.1 hypothetical protein EDB95_1551 [Dinghuibacter silviterrae]